MCKIFKTFSAISFISIILLTGCASQSNWQPTVDPYNDKYASYVDRDMVECRELAQHAAGGDAVKETGKGALIGGAIGAAAGAVIGAAVGAPGTGAVVGAAVGGVGGASKQGFWAEGQYKRAYANCMRNRGHNVLN